MLRDGDAYHLTFAVRSVPYSLDPAKRAVFQHATGTGDLKDSLDTSERNKSATHETLLRITTWNDVGNGKGMVELVFSLRLELEEDLSIAHTLSTTELTKSTV